MHAGAEAAAATTATAPRPAHAGSSTPGLHAPPSHLPADVSCRTCARLLRQAEHPHTYNAAEKPHKSAMRPSIDERKCVSGQAAATSGQRPAAAADGSSSSRASVCTGAHNPIALLLPPCCCCCWCTSCRHAHRSDAYSRRSSAGASTVGFAVSMDAPEAGEQRACMQQQRSVPWAAAAGTAVLRHRASS